MHAQFAAASFRILLENEMSLKAISRTMGHSKELITANVYINKQQIIADGTKAVEQFLEDVLPEEESLLVDINMEVFNDV